ncbi:protein kinase [Streptomyces sp. SCSIO 75703]|uniref:serine/threonine-protein kinase n=1 Tax=Streptomyces sp. SCSIO 75703 TaxID=3112165 RepID=UPI0030CA79E3
MGEVFAGRYELVDPIGRGGVGAVWRAWDHRRRRYVAAKVLQQRDAHALLRFVREQALRIDHPHVVAPASWAADDDQVLFTMDLVTGGSLVHLVGDYGPLPPVFVCTLLDQLLSGLAAVHAEDVVHRDIKPANLLLEATGARRPRLRLSDFGIAMRLGEPRLTETDLVVGTPGYLAPEQLMGAEPDFAADLFAAGLVALYLLEGAKPDAKALVQHFAEHGTPSAPRGIPDPLWQVVAGLLEPDPSARFRTATGARKALAAAVELLPEPGPDDELIEIFDQVGPLPPGFGPDGPLARAPAGTPPGAPSTTPEDAGAAPRRSSAPAPPALPAPLGSSVPPAPSTTPSASSGPSASVDPSAPSGLPIPPAPPASSVPSAPLAPRIPHPPQVPPLPPGPAAVEATPSPSAPDHGGRPPAGGEGAPPIPQSAPPGPEPGRDPASEPPAGPGPDQGPVSPSDTGSFPLPPPRSTVTSLPSPTPQPPLPPPTPQGHPGQSPAVPPPPPSHRPPPLPPAQAPPHALHPHTGPSASPTPPPWRTAEAPTAGYTARDPRTSPPAPGRAQHRAARRRRRPGPPASVAVPLLLLALACYAVGFWALTRL